MADIETDVPSPINLRSEPEAREWTRTAMLKRPWRTDFFARIADELRRVSDERLAILELGSGPGFLAEHILTALPASTYTALDFSPAMHALATERLGVRADHVTFIGSDFRVADWAAGLPTQSRSSTARSISSRLAPCVTHGARSPSRKSPPRSPILLRAAPGDSLARRRRGWTARPALAPHFSPDG